LKLGIGAAGMLRLIVPQQTYNQCNGGATLLNGEMMRWWQVIERKFSSKIDQE
jgi:hypothetical protein